MSLKSDLNFAIVVTRHFFVHDVMSIKIVTGIVVGLGYIEYHDYKTVERIILSVRKISLPTLFCVKLRSFLLSKDKRREPPQIWLLSVTENILLAFS
ncbi:CLUMA_CG000890, isoform A [Clunio marinus]|uniref:CLUMA_CG000890, isoform A n=1 Tax=Clunio marinus TaxID=568069 RepID=A0A1J1HKS2_9DIPT|nr:CLUMA_CG000890, isoform A [Clunio marinus]